MSVPTLQRLQLDNYRSFRAESVDLDNPTFLVGQNGAGKSNFADAISFLAEAMGSPLSAVFKRRGGFERVVHRRGKTRYRKIGFHLKLRDLDDHARQATYDLTIRPRGYRLEVAHERCTIKGRGGSKTSFCRSTLADSERRTRWVGDIDPPQLSPSTLALALVGDSRFEPVFNFVANMRTYCIDPLTLQSDHEQYGDMELDEDGSNVARVLRQMEKKSPEDWEEICELLASAVPGFAEVHARRRNGELTLEFLLNLREGRARFDASDMSDGTLRTLEGHGEVAAVPVLLRNLGLAAPQDHQGGRPSPPAARGSPRRQARDVTSDAQGLQANEAPSRVQRPVLPRGRAYKKSRSFRKLTTSFGQLLTAMEEPAAVWPPPSWRAEHA